MTPRLRLLILPFFLLGLVLSPLAGATEPDLATLPPHPRLFASAADWDHLKARLAAEPDLAAYHAALLTEARRILPLPPVERVMTGRRLLHVSRELLHRTLVLAYAARTTGDAAFARRAEAEMLAAARFSDWNPEHFLDVGEATTALAIGYDWLFDSLAPTARAEIRTAILEKGLKPGLDPKDRRNSWQRAEHNWNQVCFGGLTLGALAIGDEAPDEAGRLLALARPGIRHGLKPYAPDGVYPEGPSYWAYGTSYQVLLIAALESALGTDSDLKAAPGFLASAGAYLQTTGPSGRAFNFSDGGERIGFEPAVFWFARATRDPGLLLFEQRRLATPDGRAAAARGNRLAPLAALWWPTPGSVTTPALPLACSGRGPNPLVVFRESWTDPAAAYLAAKAGAAELNHGHMDAGSFVYEADGVRWAIDLGMQDYESLESKKIDLWNRRQNSARWSVFRLGNFSHNTLTLGGQLHRVDGHATVERFSDRADQRFAILDLSPVFTGQAAQVRRGFRLLPDRGFLVQDEIAGLAPNQSVRWQMATRARVEVHGDTATLTQDGRTLTVRILAPAGLRFTAVPADPPADGFNAPNPGVTLLRCELLSLEPPGLTLSIQLTPGPTAGPAATVTPLAGW